MTDPIFIVGAPRSGGLALAHGMSLIPEMVGIELEPTGAGSGSRSALRAEIEDRVGEALAAELEGAEDARRGEPLQRRPLAILGDGSPRVALVAATLPGARFVLVHRDPVAALPEMLADAAAEADPAAASAQAVVSHWTSSTAACLDGLEKLPPERWCVVGHDALLLAARPELERLCRFLGIDPGGDLAVPANAVSALLASKPPSSSPPELIRLLADTADLAERAADLLPAATAPPQESRASDDPERDSPLRSVHTASFAELLEEAGSSLLVSTYHAGSLICLRPERSRVNTHFRGLPRPMGMAVAPGRLSIGTQSQVIEYRDLPEAAPRLEPEGTHDACFLPRRIDLTGDISVHDVAYAGGETWVVATRFSCLATLDGEHSFVPRWNPDFITELVPEDRCHLNGLCVVDDEVAYVTALDRSDEAGGWRDHRVDGGLLIDVRSGETVIGDLSMPHSPRMHDGRLWVLESGRGTICSVDPVRGERETVAELPGFTRGLTFVGPYALIGLSKIRETATFGGLPVTERLRERQCGVWIVDTRDGEIAGFLRFDDLVQEIYDLVVLDGLRMPEIADAGSSAAEISFDLPV